MWLSYESNKLLLKHLPCHILKKSEMSTRHFLRWFEEHIFLLPMCIYFSRIYLLYIYFLRHIRWCGTWEHVLSEYDSCIDEHTPIMLTFQRTPKFLKICMFLSKPYAYPCSIPEMLHLNFSDRHWEMARKTNT